MTGHAVSRGGLRVEFRPDVDRDSAWAVHNRSRMGRGPSIEAAFDDLIAQLTSERNVIVAAKRTYLADRTPTEEDE